MEVVDYYIEHVRQWHDREWFDVATGQPKTIPQILNKLTEEVGELNAAITKWHERRTDRDWEAEARKEFGDVLIVLMVLASRLRILITPTFVRRWREVRKRRSGSYREPNSAEAIADSPAARRWREHGWGAIGGPDGVI